MNQLKNKPLVPLAVIALTLGLGVSALSYTPTAQKTVSDSVTSERNDANATETGRTELSYQARPGITSLAQLKDEASNVVTVQSDYGEYADSIEGHKGGTDGKYWSFYINGEMAQVGAGSYIQEEGDFIEWKFQKL